jgi:hypothetical protein
MGGLNYFEVEIKKLTTNYDQRKDNMGVAIGACSEYVSLRRALTGHAKYSIGYYSDGSIHIEGYKITKYGPTFGEGDTVGCGLDWNVGSFYFTLNGRKLGELPFRL